MLKKLDLFGALHKARILNEDPFYKSTYGGIWSILIYGFCLFYFIYGMVQWRYGYFLPKVTTMETLSQDMEFNIDYEILSLKLSKANGSASEIDPFQQENNILTPQLMILENNIMKQARSIYSDGEGLISVSNIQLMKNSTYELQVMFGLAKCLKNCASDEEIEAFFNLPSNMIEMKINLMQYNVNQKKYEIIPRTLKFALTRDQTFYGQLILKLMDSSINSGVITDQIEETQILNNFELIGQTINLNYIQNAANIDIYTEFLIQLSTTKIQQTIAYPKFGEILAAIGSIIQAIMLLKYIPLYTNENLAYKEIVDTMISYYYPEFKDYQITHTTLGIMRVRRKGEIIDKTEFSQVYNKISDVARQKLTLANLIYEISRISFLLKEKFSAEDIQKTHELGIPWPKSIDQEQEQEMESLNRQYSEFSLFMKQPLLQPNQKIKPKS